MNAAKLNMETPANNEWMDGERKKSFLKLPADHLFQASPLFTILDTYLGTFNIYHLAMHWNDV